MIEVSQNGLNTVININCDFKDCNKQDSVFCESYEKAYTELIVRGWAIKHPQQQPRHCFCRTHKNTYDSTAETQEHITTVRKYMFEMVDNLMRRREVHDASKLENPEKEMFDEFTPKLRALTYGSEEYKQTLAEMGPALQHHYEHNSHHPEHYANGVCGMSLMDVLEMVADWKAASQRHADGNFAQSLEHNRKRFEISDQLFEILVNTVKELGW